MDEMLTQLSVGGIFAVLVIREGFNFMTRAREAKVNDGRGSVTMRQQLNDLHTASIRMGVQMPELISTLKSLDHTLQQFNGKLGRLVEGQLETKERIKNLSENFRREAPHRK